MYARTYSLYTAQDGLPKDQQHVVLNWQTLTYGRKYATRMDKLTEQHKALYCTRTTGDKATTRGSVTVTFPWLKEAIFCCMHACMLTNYMTSYIPTYHIQLKESGFQVHTTGMPYMNEAVLWSWQWHAFSHSNLAKLSTAVRMSGHTFVEALTVHRAWRQ